MTRRLGHFGLWRVDPGRALAWLLAPLAAASFVLSPPASAQTPLFSESSELAITIDAPLNTLVRRAARSTDPYPATVTIATDEGPQSYPIKISARGFSRRTGGICNFPPIRLDFDKDALGGTLLEGQNRLKLVTHCQSSNRYEQLIVLEHLAYLLYNELTPLSFAVRPARVTYRDTDGRRREETYFAFLIEDEDDLAERNGRIALEVRSNEVKTSQLDPDIAALNGLFQFMIGNLDWDMTYGPAGDECCHNGKLLAAEAAPGEAVVPVPYDFDHSGFVNAPYAMPPEQVPVNSVRSRYYRGLCIHNDELPGAVATLQEKRAALLAIIDGETRLSASRRGTAHEYIEDFYEILDDPDRFERLVINRCG